ncbi:Serine/threonine-protein kinase MRCK alpha [Nymphon striatum]|nr:Serine/threonine-protein kinase MRCK alpha [Nymphon striatum]
MSVDERTHILDQLFLGGPIRSSGLSLSIETLIDVLVVLYDECSSSALRKEKTVLSDEQLYDLKGDIVNFIFDNADINVRTLTGHGTCHVMSGIACVTPTGEETAQPTIPRSTQRVERSIVPNLKGQFGHVPIKMYNKPNTTGFKSITIRPLEPPKKQLRRAQQKPSSDILFELTMKTTTSKQAFLSNAKNKDRLIKDLMEKFESNGLTVKQNNADAD